jgi:Mn-dependent DtxR family transcriptional regulator
MNNLNTSNPYSYEFITPHLEVYVLGGVKANKLESLRITIALQKPKNNNVLRHSLDLYNDNQVERLVRKVAERLEIGTSVVREVLQQLTKALENYRFLLIEQEEQQYKTVYKEITQDEIVEAEIFLKQKNLIAKTNELIGVSGVIGEEVNRILMYLIFTSRKTGNPLHVISLGSSGAGKTHLQSKVAELIPEEDKVEITVLSANAFYYFNRTELQHKLILIEDLDGAESVLYPLRELQSKKRITKTVVHKDAKGTTKTIHLTVEGPVTVAGCTTQESIYEDNSNRSFLLYIDESEDQDNKIMNYQRLSSAGKINQEDEIRAKSLLQNVQRILKPIKVVNPYAEYLELPASVFKPRRTNAHYLQFIEAVTFYHQFQREKKYDTQTGEEFIETTLEDIQNANELITEVLLRKSDSLTGACRNYLEEVKQYLEKENQASFTAFEIRRKLKVKKTTQWRYHQQLLDNYYIQKLKNKGELITRYGIAQPKEYQELQTAINEALADCLGKIGTVKPTAKCSAVPARSTPKTEQLKSSKSTR